MSTRIQILLPAINLLISGANIYLFKVYGSLVWWWRHLEQEGFFNGKQPPSFFSLADQIHILAIVMSLLNLCFAIVLWRAKISHPKLAMPTVVVATINLLVCILVSV